MSERKYELLLAGVIAARATSFLFSKIVLQSMSTFNLLFIRFLIAFVLLLLVFHKKLPRITKRELAFGAVIGTLFFLVMASELTALLSADSSTVSLLENCAIILVPLFEAIINRKAPKKLGIISAVIAMAGVFCLTAQTGSFSSGIAWGLVSAVLYAIAIITTAKLSHLEVDAFNLGIVQVGTMGLLSLAASFALEAPVMPTGGTQWLLIIILALVCTGFGFTLQPVAQSKVSAERAGLLCAISPAIAALLGAAAGEAFGLLSALGLLLILFSLALPYIIKPKTGE